jgi:hypothetical protein
MAERTAEFILGLLGGILGIVVAPSLFLLGAFLLPWGGGMYFAPAIGGGVLSILGLIGAAFVKSHARLASIVMLVSGGLGLVFGLGLWIGALLLLVAGIIGFIRKEKRVEPTPTTPTLPLGSPESGIMFCSTCGKQIARGSTFCQFCGARHR